MVMIINNNDNNVAINMIKIMITMIKIWTGACWHCMYNRLLAWQFQAIQNILSTRIIDVWKIRSFGVKLCLWAIYWRKMPINPSFQKLKHFQILAQGFSMLKREFIFSKGSKIFRFFCSTNENVKMRCSIFEQS